jgi:hypothetical protein
VTAQGAAACATCAAEAAASWLAFAGCCDAVVVLAASSSLDALSLFLALALCCEDDLEPVEAGCPTEVGLALDAVAEVLWLALWEGCGWAAAELVEAVPEALPMLLPLLLPLPGLEVGSCSAESSWLVGVGAPMPDLLFMV